MKLKLRIDLAGLKRQAQQEVDARFSTAPSLLTEIYATKASLAQNCDDLLAAEAKERGLTVEALSELILTRRTEADKRLLEIDRRRRELKARIESATSEQEIRRALAEATTDPL